MCENLGASFMLRQVAHTWLISVTRALRY